jgi:hypothetical protein
LNQQLAAPVGQTNPQRLAWGVLLISFAIFCSICVVIIIGVDYFLFQSSTPLTPQLSLGRGSVGIIDRANPIEQVGRNTMILTPGMVLSTDPQSQSTVGFLDTDNILVARVTLSNNSSMTLRRATYPRFDWSRAQPVIDLVDVAGSVNVDVLTLDSVLVNIATRANAVVKLQGQGQYSLTSNSAQLSVFNFGGQAVVIAPGAQTGHLISANSRGIVNYETNEFVQKPGFVDLLADGSFSQAMQGVDTTRVWICGNDPGDNPPGEHQFIESDGMRVLRFIRADDATSHGRTSCVQSFGQAGMDARSGDFNYLVFRATFNIVYHSLDACGIDGSECPLMLRMDYLDADGEAQKWFHGFYAREAGAQSGYPLRCATCVQDHEQINPNAWYTYESPNLFSLFEEPPASIVAVWFYASGHQFDVRVRDVDLLAGRLDIGETPPEQPGA